MQADLPSSVGTTRDDRNINYLSAKQMRYPIKGYDMYHHSKAIVERMVLAANDRGLRTTVIRSCGMLGYVYLDYDRSFQH